MYVRIHIHTYLCACILTYVRTYLHTYLYKDTHRYHTHTYTHTRTHTHTHAHTHTHTHMHTHTHTHTHTHAEACTYAHIKTHGCVSAAKKAVWRTSVLFTGTANSPFSAPCISITTGPISIKFTYFMPSIYATLHTKLERNRPSSSQDMCSRKMPYFLHLFLLLLRTVLQK